MKKEAREMKKETREMKKEARGMKKETRGMKKETRGMKKGTFVKRRFLPYDSHFANFHTYKKGEKSSLFDFFCQL